MSVEKLGYVILSFFGCGGCGHVGLCVCTGPTGVSIYFFFSFNAIKLLDQIGFDLIQIQFDRIDKKSYDRITLLIHI